MDEAVSNDTLQWLGVERDGITLTKYHIPVSSFSQRIDEILLSPERLEDRMKFHVVDITKPREDWLLEPAVAWRDPYRRAVEKMMTAMEGLFVSHGYRYVMNQDVI